MSSLEIILPVFILGIAFTMKLFVDRSPNLPLAIETTYELPIDVVFLALTFAAAFSIIRPTDAGRGLAYFAVYVVVAMISIVLSRRSTRYFDKERLWASGFAFLLNFMMAVSALVFSIRLVSKK